MGDDTPYSGAWLRSKSDAELREIADGAMAGSPAFHGVSVEINRRASERSERRQMFWIRATFGMALIVGVAGIVVTLLKR